MVWCLRRRCWRVIFRPTRPARLAILLARHRRQLQRRLSVDRAVGRQRRADPELLPVSDGRAELPVSNEFRRPVPGRGVPDVPDLRVRRLRLGLRRNSFRSISLSSKGMARSGRCCKHRVRRLCRSRRVRSCTTVRPCRPVSCRAEDSSRPSGTGRADRALPLPPPARRAGRAVPASRSTFTSQADARVSSPATCGLASRTCRSRIPVMASSIPSPEAARRWRVSRPRQ